MVRLWLRIMMVCAAMLTAACMCGGFGAFATPTPKPTPTDAPPTRTPTLPPGVKPTATQTHRETAEIVERMIQSNGGCELPCWLGGGITLGETTVSDADAWMTANGIEYREYTIPEPDSDELYVATFNLRERDEVVRSYNLYIRPFGDNPLRFVTVIADRYSWSHLLTIHGEPTAILVDVYGTIRSNLDYRLMMVYETLGFSIEYSGNATSLDDQTVEICPRLEEIELVQLEVINPRYDGSIGVENFSYSGDASLLAKTGMSIDSFTNQFKDRESQACFQVYFPK